MIWTCQWLRHHHGVRLNGALNQALEAFLAVLDRYTLQYLVRGTGHSPR
jgi:DNA-binding IscR family transcriptional regulator